MQTQAVTSPVANGTGSDDGLEVLTFDLAGETFALEAVLVREVLDKSPAAPYVPGAPASRRCRD